MTFLKKTKDFSLALVFCLSALSGSAQLDANSLFALPRATTIEMNAISTPRVGSVLFNTDEQHLYRFTSTGWKKETLTTFVNNGDNTFTYTNEDGGTTTLDIAALETVTTIGLNADNINIDYVDEDGVTTQLNLTAIVKNLETLTSLVDNNNGTFTFTNEDGGTTVLDAKNLETLTTIALNVDETNIDYTDEDGIVTKLNLTAIVKNLETLTSLVDNNDGTFTFTNEDGGTTILDVSNLETLTTIALNADETNIDYTDEDGVVTKLDLTAIIRNLETLSTLALNADNTNLDFKDEDGVVTKVNLTTLVQNLETLTSLVDNNDGTFTFTNEDGGTTILDVSNLETLTSLVQDSSTGIITYTDEDAGTSTANVISADTGNQITSGSDGGAFLSLPSTYAVGKINGDGTAASIYGATVARIDEGDYQVTFANAAPNVNYVVQLTTFDCKGDCPGNSTDNYDNPGITYYDQLATGFKVNIGDSDNGAIEKDDIDLEFMFTITVMP